MIFRSSCMAIGYVDSVLDELVKQGMARVIKSGKDKHHNGTYINEYAVYVGEDGWAVNVKLWFNNLKNCAEVRISTEGMELLIEAVTVVSLMKRLGRTISKNGNGVNQKDLEELIRMAITQATGNEEKLEIIP